jgi:hypothetical protein
MYTHIWNKYLPIIRILLKRSAAVDQTLQLNRVDFERAGSGRKAGYSFHIDFSKGRVTNVISSSSLARDLAAAMQQDDGIKPLLLDNEYQIGLSTKFQLSIKNCNLQASPQEAAN